MRCAHCGFEIAEDVKFCPECGAAVADAAASQAQAAAPADEPLRVISASEMGDLQRRCPYCGAAVYAGSRRCSRCGRVVGVAPAASSQAVRPAEAQLTRRHFVGAAGAAAIVVGMLALGGLALWVVPRAFEGLVGSYTPTLVERPGIDDEINAQIEAGADEEAQAQTEPEQPASILSVEAFPRSWKGTYEGASQVRESGTILRAVDFSFERVEEDGTLEGICDIGIADTGPGATNASYRVAGRINWQTGEIELSGTEWLYSGDLARMLRYVGTVDVASQTISGSTYEFDGSRIGPWSMSRQG